MAIITISMTISMTAKRDIIEFFKSQKCETCPFKKECDSLYQVTRAASTNAHNICDAIFYSVKLDW